MCHLSLVIDYQFNNTYFELINLFKKNSKIKFEAKTYTNQYEILLTNELRPYLFLILFA